MSEPTAVHREEAHALHRELVDGAQCSGDPHFVTCDIIQAALDRRDARRDATVRAEGRAEGAAEAWQRAANFTSQHVQSTDWTEGEKLVARAVGRSIFNWMQARSDEASASQAGTADRYQEGRAAGLTRAAEIARGIQSEAAEKGRLAGLSGDERAETVAWSARRAAERIADSIRAELPADAPPQEGGTSK